MFYYFNVEIPWIFIVELLVFLFISTIILSFVFIYGTHLIGYVLNKIGIEVDENEITTRIAIPERIPDFSEIRGKNQRNFAFVRRYSLKDKPYHK